MRNPQAAVYDPDAAPKRRLVVVGNGMAGARTVEEILARGGGDQFFITMIGDEPYGNYNRIMLSQSWPVKPPPTTTISC